MTEQDTQLRRSAEDPSDPFIGRVIVGKFRLGRLLGVGAMGRVYEADHLSLSKKVAVKVLHQHLVGDEGLARRFHREAKSASCLNHPNSISIMDFGQDVDGTLYIAMELLEGVDLNEVLRREAPLPLERTVRILGQVCLALDEAHHNRIVHRDLKAENVMLVRRRDEVDFVKVCDFGIAKVQDPKSEDPDSAITVAGMVCGTPEYMSPEQARGDPLDGRSDLYSLGVLLYYMVAGELPFTAETALGCVTKHLTEEPAPPRQRRPDLDIPPVLEAFILRTISKDPDLRPSTASEFRQELLEVERRIAAGDLGDEVSAAGSGEATSPSGLAEPPGASRRVVWWIVAGVALLMGIGGAAILSRTGTGDAARHGRPGMVSAAADASIHAMAAPPPAHARDAALPPRGAAQDGAVMAGAVGRERPPHPIRAMDSRRRRRRRHRPRPTMREPPSRPERPEPMERPPGKTPFQEAYDQARAAFNSGWVAVAARHFKAALRLRPGHARTLKELGRCYVRLGRPCRALRYFRRYARARPKDFFVKRHIKTLAARCGGM